jgi:hypothetical protein
VASFVPQVSKALPKLGPEWSLYDSETMAVDAKGKPQWNFKFIP